MENEIHKQINPTNQPNRNNNKKDVLKAIAEF